MICPDIQELKIKEDIPSLKYSPSKRVTGVSGASPEQAGLALPLRPELSISGQNILGRVCVLLRTGGILQADSSVYKPNTIT